LAADLLADLGIAALTFLYLASVFWPLEWAYPARRGQPKLRPRWTTDLAFFAGQYLVWIGLVLAVLAELTPWLQGLVPLEVRRRFGLQPRWLQLVEVVLLGDLLIYWAHRLQHRVDWLWRFHAVHHSAEHLDWLAAHREHPLDTLYSVTIMNLPAFMLGMPLSTMSVVVSFRGLWAIFIHSNVRARLGPLGLLLGSPALHHWHHARERAGVNFGNVSPLMDVLFGTHFDPGHEPEALGLEEPGPRSYLGLLVDPLVPGSRTFSSRRDSWQSPGPR
jgi:sterol desaturase/sphingolipid hydroxylase (fatty acid hydroxylase superfamily)